MLLRVFLLLTALIAALPAAAQTTNLVPRLVAEGPVAAGGGEVELALVFEAKEGWHGYWKNPGDAGLPIAVEWEVPEGAEVAPFRFPTPQRYDAFGLVNYVYKGEHALLTRLTLPATNRGAVTVSGEGRWLACTDKICVPEKGQFSVVIPVGSGPERGDEFDRYRQQLPRPISSEAHFDLDSDRLSLAIPVPASLELYDPELFIEADGLNHIIDYAASQGFRRVGDHLVGDLKLRANAMPAEVRGVLALGGGSGLSFTAVPGEVPEGGEPIGGKGWDVIGIALLGALIGGMLLNLMPCVFPILAMKAVHLAKAGGEEKEARRDALGYTMGAMLGTAGLGLLLLAIREGGAAAGWAFQLQDPRTIFLLLILAAAITYNLAGLYRLPVLAGSMRTGGSVGTGALAAFVATPCAGPFLGAALGTALILPPAGAVGVFAALGLGLALPFLAIAFIPALRKRLPKPGEWMIKLQRWLAIPMAATVAAALWLLSRLAGEEALLIGLVAIAVLGLLLWLSTKGRALGWIAVVGAIALAIGGAMMLPARPSVEARVPDFAELWSEEAVAPARAEGRPVFVYFTADWCLSCKANEASSINREAVLEAFEANDVAVFVGDWTDGDPAITRFLEARGRAAVPLYLWYAQGADSPEELPQILTPSMLTERAQSRK
ncbi:protein-disulfide reductase DsbD family protein [Sphingomicrobium flavum]|uniref:protein-disulfide reductase DsbD family protein n=1 Tax=Sphingomicrobium flavum TaxID=1229164 RepID=UPI0021ADC096|nr:protein-disulfide reductase DsbD domain-containing protein [Sphingomicrobium flavum]